jgi:DNA-binding NarL/FixJ family response regulator
VPAPAHRLIGRSVELAALLDVVGPDGQAGHGAVLLSGDAGVGKTRLLAEVLAEAANRGMTQLVGHCIDYGDVGLPYLPFSEAFGRLATIRPELVSQLQVEFAPISRLLPQQRLIGSEAEHGYARVDRSDLFGAVLGALARIGQDRAAVLVVEDAHWADQSTRELLGFLLTRLDGERVSLMVSYRSDDLHRRHPLRTAVAEWARRPGVRRVHLDPLPDQDVRALISTLHPSPLGEQALQGIVSRAEGNAFFAEELIAAADEADRAGRTASALPAALADLLLVRLDRLSPGARDVVRLVAVAGREVLHATLEAVAGLGDAELDAALREAFEAHILIAREQSRYGFRHALLGEAVYDDLLPGERVRLHAAFAAALGRESVRGTAAELARHARQSHDLDTAYAASIRAAAEAVAVGAPQEGMRHYEAASELVGRLSPGVTVDAVQLALDTAEAAAAAGHQLRALALARDALDQLAADAAPLTRARLLHAVGTYAGVVEFESQALACTNEALKLIPQQPPTPLRIQLLSLHARTLAQLGRDDEAARWAADAVGTAAALGRPELATDARTTLAVIDNRAGDPVDAGRQFASLAVQARDSGQLGNELRTLFQLGVLVFDQGDLAASEVAYSRCWERAQQTGRPWATYGVDARCHLISVRFVAGDWDGAERLAHFTGEDPPPLAEAKLLAAGFATRVARGDDTVLAQVQVLSSQWQADGMIAIMALSHLVDLHAQRGDATAALRTAAQLVEIIAGTWQEPYFGARLRLSATALAALSADVTTLPEADRASAVHQGAQLHTDGMATVEHGMVRGAGPGPEGRAWITRLHAEWARLRWLADRDAPSEAEHVALWRATVDGFGFHPYEAARSQARLAAVLRASGDASGAAAVVERAERTATRLGARPLLAELATTGRPGAGRPSPGAPAPAGLDALTPREQDVLRLVTDGRSNRQIAHQLYISEKTVSVHVSNILAKLGVRSRTEAAALSRRG